MNQVCKVEQDLKAFHEDDEKHETIIEKHQRVKADAEKWFNQSPMSALEELWLMDVAKREGLPNSTSSPLLEAVCESERCGNLLAQIFSVARFDDETIALKVRELYRSVEVEYSEYVASPEYGA